MNTELNTTSLLESGAAPATDATDTLVGGDQREPMGILLRRLEHLLELRVTAGITPALTEHDLTAERWRVICALAAEPGQNMTRLAEAAILPPASLTRHVDRLVARGLVLRKVHPKDRRRVVAALSERGIAVFKEVRAHELAVENELRSAFGEERFDVLVDALTALPEMLAGE